MPFISMETAFSNVDTVSVEDVTTSRNGPDGTLLATSDPSELLLIGKGEPLPIIGRVVLIEEDLALEVTSTDHPNVTIGANGDLSEFNLRSQVVRHSLELGTIDVSRGTISLLNVSTCEKLTSGINFPLSSAGGDVDSCPGVAIIERLPGHLGDFVGHSGSELGLDEVFEIVSSRHRLF
jgi:hypothetical protein